MYIPSRMWSFQHVLFLSKISSTVYSILDNFFYHLTSTGIKPVHGLLQDKPRATPDIARGLREVVNRLETSGAPRGEAKRKVGQH